MSGAPLLPPQLSKCFTKHLAPPTPEQPRPWWRKRINQYCSDNWDLPEDYAGAPLEFITQLVEPILQETCAIANGDFQQRSHAAIASDTQHDLFRESALIEVPFCTSKVSEIFGLQNLPLLATTWATLEEQEIGLNDLALLISGGSMLEAIQRIQSIRAVLDISVTMMSWLNSSGNVIQASVPGSITEAFEIIRQRIVRQGSRLVIPSEVELERLAAIVGREKEYPLNLDGTVKTLANVGAELGLTRERIRQLESNYALRSMIIRRWPLSTEVLELEELIAKQLGESVVSATEAIKNRFSEFGAFPVEASIALLTAFGHSPDLFVDQKKLRRKSSFTPLSFKKSEVQRISREIAGPLGFVRATDVLDALVETYPDSDRSATIELINNAAAVSGLPDEYLFFGNPSHSQFTGTMHRMLGCTNPLSITELRVGLERLVSRRRLSALPPNDVLLETLNQLDEFIVDSDEVESLSPSLPKPDGNIDWMLRKIDSTGFDCIHKSQLFEDARLEGRKQSSIILHCSMYEHFVTLPNGCVGRIGQVPNLALVELATQQARLLRVENNFTYTDLGSIVEARIFVGNSFLDGGRFGGNLALRRQLGQQPLPVFAEGERHGKVDISNNVIYGLISGLIALDVKLGDTIEVKFDFGNNRADLTFAEFEDDDD